MSSGALPEPAPNLAPSPPYTGVHGDPCTPVEARMSTPPFGNMTRYNASSAIDGDLETLMATNSWRSNHWLSTRLAARTAVGQVAVWARQDALPWFMHCFEIYVGDDWREHGTQCGTRQCYEMGRHVPTPYVVDCAGAVGGFVTLEQCAPRTARQRARLAAARAFLLYRPLPHTLSCACGAPAARCPTRSPTTT